MDGGRVGVEPAVRVRAERLEVGHRARLSRGVRSVQRDRDQRARGGVAAPSVSATSIAAHAVSALASDQVIHCGSSPGSASGNASGGPAALVLATVRPGPEEQGAEVDRTRRRALPPRAHGSTPSSPSLGNLDRCGEGTIRLGRVRVKAPGPGRDRALSVRHGGHQKLRGLGGRDGGLGGHRAGVRAPPRRGADQHRPGRAPARPPRGARRRAVAAARDEEPRDRGGSRARGRAGTHRRAGEGPRRRHPHQQRGLQRGGPLRARAPRPPCRDDQGELHRGRRR